MALALLAKKPDISPAATFCVLIATIPLNEPVQGLVADEGCGYAYKKR
jgi:hypothetical protein